MNPILRRRLPTLLLVLAALATPLHAQDATRKAKVDPGGASTGDDAAFDRWATIATQGVKSPARAAAGDITKSWTAPDGRTIQLVVRLPVAKGTPVTMRAVAEGEDARPAFEAAVAEALAKGSSKVLVPKGTYVFKTVAARGMGHLIVQNLSDLTIDGQDSTFVFANNEPGILVTHAQRVRLQNLTFRYDLHLASIGTIVNRDGENVFVVDPAFPVTAKDNAFYFSEIQPDSTKWVISGQRLILPPGFKTPATYAGDQTYRSEAFKQLKAGSRFVVFHYWYGPAVLRIQDSPGPTQNEDISIDHVRIESGPGFAIHGYGLKRGFAVTNTTIAADPASPNPMSTLYDAIHINGAGGDIVVTGNRIANQGDDALNIQNPIQPITAVADDGKTLKMSKYSRFISAGDELAFFGSGGDFLGTAKATDPPKALGGLDSEVKVDASVPGVAVGAVVRDVALVSSRFYVADNVIEDCKCHGMLLQIPNGLVERNQINNAGANAVRMLTDTAWGEGVGAFNIIFRKNVIRNSGTDGQKMVPWSAITVYGGARGGAASALMNRDIEIVDNQVEGASQGCITVANADRVKVSRNQCDGTNRKEPGKNSLTVVNSRRVELDGNRRGQGAGGIAVDPASQASTRTQAEF